MNLLGMLEEGRCCVEYCPVYQPPERVGYSFNKKDIIYNGTNEHVNE